MSGCRKAVSVNVARPWVLVSEVWLSCFHVVIECRFHVGMSIGALVFQLLGNVVLTLNSHNVG